MVNLVYGVSGEGSGHSSRAREMINHLEQLGHTVKVVSYDRGYRNLKNDFDVFETEGLHIASSDNRVSKVKTFTENLPRLPRGHIKLHALRKNIFKQFRPDCVITDFEEKLNEYHAADNSAIKAKLGELLKDNCALVKTYHRRRKK